MDDPGLLLDEQVKRAGVSPLRFVRLVTLFGILGIALWWCLFEGLYARFYSSYLDSAGFADLINSQQPNWLLNSSIWTSFEPYLRLNSFSADALCPALQVLEPSSTSTWAGHAYVVSIPLGVLGELFGLSAVILANAVTAFSFAVALILPITLLVITRVPWWLSIAVTVLLCTWPIYWMALSGQLYYDKLFFGLGTSLILTIYGISRGHTKLTFIAVALIIISALTSERAALYTALVAIAYPLSLGGFSLQRSRALLVVGIAGCFSGMWFVWWWTSIQQSLLYGGAGISPALVVHRLLNVEPSNIGLFSLMFIPLLGLSALYWRNIPVALGAIAPNFLFSVGGAELTGYSTHYHSLWGSVLVGLATVGVIHRYGGSNAKNNEKRRRRRESIFTAATLLAVSTIYWITGQSSMFVADTLNLLKSGLGIYDQVQSEQTESGRRSIKEALEGLEARGVKTISAPEILAPHFVGRAAKYEYFPVGIGRADALMVPYPAHKDQPIFFPYSQPPGYTPESDQCLQQIMETKYETVDTISPPGWELKILVRSQPEKP